VIKSLDWIVFVIGGIIYIPIYVLISSSIIVIPEHGIVTVHLIPTYTFGSALEPWHLAQKVAISTRPNPAEGTDLLIKNLHAFTLCKAARQLQ
jgi:hypothetical protein